MPKINNTLFKYCKLCKLYGNQKLSIYLNNFQLNATN